MFERQQKRLFVIIFLLLVVFGIFFFLSRNEIRDWWEPSHKRLPLFVVFLDVGQGDASFLEFSDGTQMLIDCAVDARILEALGRHMKPWDKTIDYLVVTHPDRDHYGGCVDVLRRFEVKHIVISGYTKENSGYFKEFEAYSEEEGAVLTTISSLETWNIASATVRFLFPDAPLESNAVLSGFPLSSLSNNTSVVLRVSVEEQDILFLGDAERELEAYLVEKYGTLLESEVLKVSHHGSNSSSELEFLDLVKPKISVISVGKDNSYGHPSTRVVNRLKRVGAEVWRTDEFGDIILNIQNDAVYVENLSRAHDRRGLFSVFFDRSGASF